MAARFGSVEDGEEVLVVGEGCAAGAGVEQAGKAGGKQKQQQQLVSVVRVTVDLDFLADDAVTGSRPYAPHHRP